MYRHILVPIDGSRTAAGALHEACRLAHEQHALLRLGHVREASVVESALRMGAVADGRDSERVAALSRLRRR
ncbi:MAG: universal stress protein [Betaproteobacteria bacterium]|nr:universal stress protein [Betaproteobacteria bacterium]